MKYIRLILLALIVLTALISAMIGMLSYAEITLPLESARKQFIKKASELTGSEVRIDGEVRLAISFFPTLVVDNLHIANKHGWKAEDILSVAETRVQIALLPLFSGQLKFLEISASTIWINLQQAKDGRQNWQSFLPSEKKTKEKAITPESTQNSVKKFWIEEFRLTDVTLNYIDDSLSQEFTHQIDMLVINTHDKNRLTASIQGTSKDIPYTFTATSNLLRNLISNKPWQLDMQGQVANRPLKLDISIGQTKPALTGTVRFDAKEVEFGKILSWLKLADDLDVYSDSISFTAELAGNNLKSLLEQSAFALRLNDGYWKLHDPAGKDFKKITFATAAILSKKNSPVSLDFSGDLNGEAIQMELSTNKLSAFFTELKKIHLDITTNIAKSTIDLKGDIDLPISQQSFIIDVDVKGQKLDDWDGLLKSSIPPFGPYRLRGSFRANQKGFRIKNVRLKIGNSDLGGQIIINTIDKRTHWALDLVSQTFQINDFKTEDYSLFPGKGKEPGEPGVKSESVLTDQQGSKGRSGTTATYPNTSATLNLEARQVLSGKDNLGGGKLHINLTGDSLSVDDFNLNIPGGSVEGALTLQRVEDGLTGILKLNMDKFDYGVLYRYIKPDSTYDGLISTRVNLNLAGYDAMHLLDHANGTIDFVIWPKKIGAGILNIWSVNLFLAILPELKKKESKLNCATAL
ncbi:MAG TPA: AsmA family protein, partial [Gammaproteobacteria bacterium]|nr:AsmA family protein [Gammaproteobacteria bacterium]